MTLGGVGFLESSVFGIVVDLPTGSQMWNQDIQRAEGDGSGEPVFGTRVIVETMRADRRRYVDTGSTAPLELTKTYVYRYRLNRSNATPGTWSAWSEERKVTDLTGQITLPEPAASVAEITDFRLTDRDATTVTYEWTRNRLTEEVWVYTATVPQPVTGDNWPAADSFPDQILETADTYTADVPEPGQVRLLQVEPRDKNLTAGPVWRAIVYPFSTPEEAPGLIVQPSQTGSAGRITITTNDPDATIDGVFFSLSPDGDNFSGFSEDTSVPYQATVALSEKHNAAIRWKVVYTLNGKQREISGVHTFDVDKTAHVRHLAASLNPDTGELSAEVAGDSDTVRIYLTHTTDDTEPVDPTAAGADETVDARSGSVTFSGTVAQGERGRVKARGVNAAGQLAPADTIQAVRTDRAVRVDGQNLLGPDAGPVHQATGSGTIYSYHPAGGWSLDVLGLSVGDVASLSADLTSATGADDVVIRIVFEDSGGTVLDSATTPAVNNSDFERSSVEDVEVPASTAAVFVRAINQSGTEQASVRRAMLNRGPVALPFTEPPLRSVRETLDDLPDGTDFGRVLRDALSPTGEIDLGAASGWDNRDGTSVPRDPGGTLTLQQSSKLDRTFYTSDPPAELYTYDPDDSTLGGVVVGVRAEGTGVGGSAGTFDLVAGAETFTGVGGEQSGLSETTVYHVGWDLDADALIVSTNKSNLAGEDIVFFGSIESTTDVDSGSGGTTSPDVGDGRGGLQ